MDPQQGSPATPGPAFDASVWATDPAITVGLADAEAGHIQAHSPAALAAAAVGSTESADGQPADTRADHAHPSPALLHVTTSFAQAWADLPAARRAGAATVMGGVQREPRHPAYNVTAVPDSPVKIAVLAPHLAAAFTLSNEGVGGYGIVWVALLG